PSREGVLAGAPEPLGEVELADVFFVVDDLDFYPRVGEAAVVLVTDQRGDAGMAVDDFAAVVEGRLGRSGLGLRRCLRDGPERQARLRTRRRPLRRDCELGGSCAR